MIFFMNVLAALIGVAFLLYKVWVRVNFAWADPIPCTKQQKPIIGVASRLSKLTMGGRYFIMMRYSERYPVWSKVWFGPFRLALYILEPSMLQKIYNSSECLDKPAFYKLFGLGNGLVTVNAHNWRSRRRMMNFAFTLKVLQSFIPIFEDCSQKICKVLEDQVGAGKFDVIQYVRQASFDMILATSFGDKENQVAENQIIKRLLLEIHEIISLRMFKILYHSDLIFRFSKYYSEDEKARKECFGFADKLYEKRKKIVATKRDTNENVEFEESSKKPQILVDLIAKMKAENEWLTKEEIQHHMFTMFSAGNETISCLVSGVILFSAIHPEVQEKIVAELREVFFAPDVEIDYDQLKKLTYMDMVMKETMRIAPPVPLIARRTTGEVEINGVKLPKGVDILVNLCYLHRRPQDWGERADDFDPDNFLPTNVEKRHPYSYMPFSLGPRNCIGEKYSIISGKILLVHLFKTFKFSTEMKWTDVKFKFDVHLFLKTPHWVSIERRQFYDS